MPKLEEAEIFQAVETGRLSVLSIDTCIFHRYKFALESGLLKRVSQFVSTGIKVLLPDVVCREIRAHMISDAVDAQGKFKAVVKSLGSSWGIAEADRAALVDTTFYQDSPETRVDTRLSTYRNNIKFEEAVTSQLTDLSELLNRYFSASSPFGAKEDRKHEFPDAMALMSLEAYAKSSNLQILVVSTDKGWIDFCDESEHLVCIRELPSAMSYLQRVPLVASARLAERLAENEIPQLQEAVRSELDGFIEGAVFHIDASSDLYYEYQVEKQEIISFIFSGDPLFVLVERPEEEQLVFQADLTVKVKVTCNFEFAVHDSVDRDYVGIGSSDYTVESDLMFSITFRIDGNLESNFDVGEVEILTYDDFLDFGFVGISISDYED